MAWYRFATSWRRRAGGYLALVLVVGLGGGLALGSVAAARRTASSFSVFSASTNPSDLTIEPAGGAPISLAKDEQLSAAIRHYPHVRHVESYVALGGSFRLPGARAFKEVTSSVQLVGSVDGLLLDQDRFTVTQGHRADPADPRQVLVTEDAAKILGLRVGQSLEASVNPNGDAPNSRPYRLTVVGIGLLNREVVQDQIERFPTYIVGTPALTRAALVGTPLAYFGVQLDGAPGAVASVERRWNSTERYFTDFQVAAQTVQEADQSIRPEALALGAFGCIAGLTTLLIALEELARQRRNRDDDLHTMRALGASQGMTLGDSLVGATGAIVVGGVLAAVVAVALSPLSPIGPIRSVYPDGGFAADWAVLGLGALALVAVLLTGALVGAALGAPARRASRASSLRRSGVADAVSRSTLPPSAAVGTRFALDAGDPSRGSGRWVLVGAVTALLVVTATLTFGHSLQNLVSQPPLYGWNWDEAVLGSDGYGPVPQTVINAVAQHHLGVAESGVTFVTLQLDGVEVPVLLTSPGATVAPPIVTGHGLEAKNQIVVGASTLAQLHAHLGATIAARFVPGFPRHPARLTVVGVATMPAIGIAEGLHTSMGIGAVVPVDAGQFTEQLGPQGYPGCVGPNMVLLRANAAAGPIAAEHAATDLARTASTVLAAEPPSGPCGGNQASVLTVQRPAQIVNYRSMGRTPVLLALALAAGATVALGLTLVASVRRRRRELAILKAIGFTPRQLQASVLWQAGIVAAVGIVVGVPLGAALGRWLWTLFADEIGAIPAPAVPVWSVTLAASITLALAVFLSAVPGRLAARTPAVTALTSE